MTRVIAVLEERRLVMRAPHASDRRQVMLTVTDQGKELVQYDFTPEQYKALIKLTATLCKVFPKIKCDYPRDASGKLIPHKLPDEELEKYQGVLGHYHIQTNKTDPGPALQWDYLIDNAQRLMNGGFAPASNDVSKGRMRARM